MIGDFIFCKELEESVFLELLPKNLIMSIWLSVYTSMLKSLISDPLSFKATLTAEPEFCFQRHAQILRETFTVSFAMCAEQYHRNHSQGQGLLK